GGRLAGSFGIALCAAQLPTEIAYRICERSVSVESRPHRRQILSASSVGRSRCSQGKVPDGSQPRAGRGRNQIEVGNALRRPKVSSQRSHFGEFPIAPAQGPAALAEEKQPLWIFCPAGLIAGTSCVEIVQSGKPL